jgi:signal transduction histidine kinase
VKVEGRGRFFNRRDRLRLSFALLLELGRRGGVSFSAAIFVLAVAHGAMAAAPKRVLLLHSFGPDLEEEDTFAGYLRTDLADKSPVPLDLYELSLDAARLSEAKQDSAFVDYIRALLAGRSPDLVITMADPAAGFAQRHRQDLFASTPIIFGLIEEPRARELILTTNDTVVSDSYDVPAVMENIFRILPATTTVAVVIGNTPIEKSWLKGFIRDIQPFERRAKFTYFNEMSFEDMLKKAAQLPPLSAIMYAGVSVDARGIPHEQNEVLGRLHAAAHVPIFGLYDYQLGRGILGGPLNSFRELSQKTTDAAANILQGASPSDIKTPPLRPGAPEYDWRELRRWGIADANLPPNSMVKFREPTPWEKYRWQILVAAAVLLGQAAAIGWLLLERRRRRAAELESQRRVLEVIHLNRTAAAGALSASIAHELNQPLGAIQSNADAAELLLAASPLDMDQLRDALADIQFATERAAEIILNICKLLRQRSEVEADEFDLNDAIADAARILDPEARERGVTLETAGVKEPLPVRADRVQLEQVILNLAVNGMDAMSGVAPDRRKLTIQTGLVGKDNVEVSVADCGVGVPREKLEEVFGMVYSTKQLGTGLGLSISRTIVEMHGGKIWAENREGGGALFRFTLPLAHAP